MIGTLEQVAISMLLSVPLGIATAVYLSEVRGALARVVRTVVEAMSAVPTIVAGLFVYSMLILTLGKMDLPPRIDAVVTTLGLGDRSGFAASIALSVSMIPVVVTTAEVVLRLVPGGLREASLALGTTQWQTVRRVVLPTARSGLVTAVLLGVARVIGETSPVLLVAGSTSELNYDATARAAGLVAAVRLQPDAAPARRGHRARLRRGRGPARPRRRPVRPGPGDRRSPTGSRQPAPAAPDGDHRRARPAPNAINVRSLQGDNQ